MTIPASDKPVDTVREEAIDQLVMNYGHGKLSLDAFERRLEQALDAKDHHQLVALTADLELKVDDAFIAKKKQELGLHYQREETPERDWMVNIFGGNNRAGCWTPADEIRMINVFGGAELDFSEAQFARQTVRIKMLCLFGGANLLVPEGVNVISKAFCIFGGMDNRATSRAPNAPTMSNAPTIIIRGVMIFGGASIKLKRTLKERLMEFGDALRSFMSPPRS